MFIRVKIDNFNELIKSTPFKLNNDAKVNKEKMNIITDKKYDQLLTSDWGLIYFGASQHNWKKVVFSNNYYIPNKYTYDN